MTRRQRIKEERRLRAALLAYRKLMAARLAGKP